MQHEARRWARATSALALGAALHLLLLALLPRHAANPHGRAQSSSSEIAFAVIAARAPESIAPASSPATGQLAARETPARPPRAPAPPPRRNEPPPSAEPAIAPATDQPPPDAPPPPVASAKAATAVPADRAAPDLSPRAAAVSTLASTQAPDEDATRDSLPARRSAELSAELARAANADVQALRQHRKLELRRDADGTCHYEGDAIDATILPDGGVRFADKPGLVTAHGLEEPPATPYTMEDRVAPQRLEATLKYTPRAWTAERDWFLRETQPLRNELADAAHARELAGAERALRKRLDAIWCDERRPKPQRRRAIFELWADASSDEIGARGREVIAQYVRRNLPAGSGDAYSGAELAQLNVGRAGRDRFEPYSAVRMRDAGVER